MKGLIFDVKELSLHDGPGIRTTVFMKGCPLRCKWCHNPDGLSNKTELLFDRDRCVGCKKCLIKCNHKECQGRGKCIYACPSGLMRIVGETIDLDVLIKRIQDNAGVLGDAFGGITFSGGEPLMQWEFLLNAAERLREYHIAIETSAYAKKEVFTSIIEKMNLVIMDIKLADASLHKFYTGVDNSLILENARILKESGIPHLFRTPLIPKITDTDENLASIKDIVGDSDWELLSYNSLAPYKYKLLGLKYEL